MAQHIVSLGLREGSREHQLAVALHWA
jgi:hypothetical protein